ncbi:VCBS repeat-containing protein [Streptomyces abyssomicinicus]|uniref:VCBS repeat-containing protein n=1 Tax=Streptomyces abyssomicinicus TaxID=574929 RepID=UPI00124F91E9|nr:VCBS repeat-containing protein [Streptomyces abyssomicinicus]
MHRRTRTTLATVAAAAVTGGLLTFTAASTAVAVDGTVASQADFNNDGIGDVATSASGAYVGGNSQAGQVVVAYGAQGTGLTAAKRSVISQDTSGVPGGAEAGDAFSSDTAYADFDGDGYDDLAVGAPGEDLGSDKDGGMVTILWGSASGLTGKGAVEIADPAAGSHDQWGRLLAAGDFDGDGRQDLAVGTSKSKLYVFKGGISRTGTYGSRQTVQAPIMAAYPPENLTAGDVNGDATTDLVVSGPEPVDGWTRNFLLFGGASGLDASSFQELRPGVISGIGDIDNDGFGDVVSGASWNAVESGLDVPYAAKGGKVWITYGSEYGVGTVQGITQDTSGVPGSSETNDMFGYELDLGDVNGDGFLDLVIGVAGENIDSFTDTGSVIVLYGSADGISGTGAQSFHQDTAGVPGGNEKYDMFGMDVKLDDVNGDGKADLTVGSGENDGNGALAYLPSDGSRITATGSRSISPTALGVATTGHPLVGANFAD